MTLGSWPQSDSISNRMASASRQRVLPRGIRDSWTDRENKPSARIPYSQPALIDPLIG